MKLIIVESPTKARTITQILGKDYKVLSSFGHVRDLPPKTLGVAIEKNYQPSYSIPRKSNKALKAIKSAITDKKSGVEKVILATDEDREGEAIAFHLKWIIQRYAPKMAFERITFHEITKPAIQKALKNPGDINLDLFNAQQARRILDRLVGYNLSPLLWKKIRYGLSAGRVQSVALRLIVEREREREKFKSQEYWTIDANLRQKKSNPEEEEIASFLAELKKIEDKLLEKTAIRSKTEAQKIKKELEKNDFWVSKLTKKESRRYPSPPYKTSTLQRDAANKLGFSAKRTMSVAQRLYEGIKLNGQNSGLITYMRTDSLKISPIALRKAQETIENKFGKDYCLESPRYFANKAKGAQEAHEAIRPTFPQKSPESIKKFLDSSQFKLYSLIWKRFIASQMKEAVFDKVDAEINAGHYELKAQGSVLKFAGFLKAYGPNFKIQETKLPNLQEKEKLNLIKILTEQHFTQPPARYTDATLIKALEEEGIGRPSTYAPTLSTIEARGYTEKNEVKQYVPQEIGFLVNDILVENFSRIMDLQFTAKMEKDLDDIAKGEKEWVKVIDDFFKPFSQEIKEKTKSIKKYSKKTDKKCPLCGKPLTEKFGRFGKFYACSGFPDCKYTEDPNKESDEELKKRLGEVKCDKCGAPMEIKRGKWGLFWGCTNYPECKGIKKIENSSGVKCPICKKGEIIEKKSRRGTIFWACNNYPECKFALSGKPTGENCPLCKSLIIEDPKTGKKKCSNKECNYQEK
jgi:DNA topoisomerase I